MMTENRVRVLPTIIVAPEEQVAKPEIVDPPIDLSQVRDVSPFDRKITRGQFLAETAGFFGKVILYTSALGGLTGLIASCANPPSPSVPQSPGETPTYMPILTTPTPKPTLQAKNTETPTAEPKPRALAQARMVSDKIDVTFLDARGNSTGSGKASKGSGTVGIFGVRNLDFYITPDRTQTVPIEQLQVVEGYPFGEKFRRDYFGIRNDVAEIMDKVSLLGATKVRIANNPEKPLKEAARLGLKPFVVYNPGKKTDTDRIRSNILTMKSYNSEIEAIQIGNEPDNSNPRYFDGTLDDYADFVRDTILVVREILPDTKVVLAAMHEPAGRVPGKPGVNNTFETLSLLKKRGVDLDKIIYAIHALTFGDTATLENRVKWLKEQASSLAISIPKDRLWISELGVNSWNKTNTDALMVKAHELTGRFYIHELPKADMFYGLVSLSDHSLDPYFYRIAARAYMMDE